MENLKFRAEGQCGPVDFDDFSKLTEAICTALERTYRASKSETGRFPRYEITQIEYGSVDWTVTPVDQAGVLEEFLSVIHQLFRGSLPRIELTGSDIRKFRQIAAPLKSRTKKIQIGDIPINSQFERNCDRLLASAPQSIGTVTGRVEGVNIHKGNFVRVYPEGEDRGIRCYFSNEQYPLLWSVMGKRVRITGLVTRNPTGIGVDSVRDIDDDIVELGEESDLPPLMGLFGLFAKSPTSIGEDWQ